MNSRSLYIIGGSGSGKSTAMGRVLEATGVTLGPHEVFWSTHFPERKVPATVHLRGHYFTGGAYLGLMRDEFPGADGLDNASGPVLREWLETARPLPELILGEGLVFSSEASLKAFHQHTDLLVLYMHAPPDEIARRQASRTHKLTAAWVEQTATRARNLAAKLRSSGISVVDNDVDAAILHASGML